MDKAEIIEKAKKYLRRLNEEGLHVDFGVLYGSFARDEANELSDIDLMVISPVFDPLHLRKDIHRLWQVAGEVDNRIEPTACGKKEWEETDWIPIIESARQEGLRITI